MTIQENLRAELIQSLQQEPAAALALVANALDDDHRSMAPGARLVYHCDAESYTLGRHEIPGLAMTMRVGRLSPDLRGTLVRRAAGYVRSARIYE